MVRGSSHTRVAHFDIYPGSRRYVCISGRRQDNYFALYFFLTA